MLNSKVLVLFLGVLIALSVISALEIIEAMPTTSVQGQMSQGTIITCYNQFNGTYFPYKVMVTYYPGNYSAGMGFPSEWSVTNYNQDHNAVVQTASQALKQGVNWELPLNNYVGGVAIPLTTPISQLPWASQLGAKGALVMQTQMAGEPLGVTLADNLLFATEDSMMGSISAINPVTGQIVWTATGLAGQAMNNAIVYNGLVIVSVGGVCFTFSQFVHYETHHYNEIMRARNGAVYAFNATDGRLVWMRFTKGEAMPAPAIYHGILAYTTGGGCFVGLNATTGQMLWKDVFPGYMGNMASVNYYVTHNGTPLFIAGFTYTVAPYGFLIAVNGYNGHLAWNATMPSPYVGANTGLGDVPPAVDQQAGLVIDNDIANFNSTANTVDTVTFALNATTGKPVWATNLGKGIIPPAFKGGMPLIHRNFVYVGAPSLGIVAKLYVNNGSIVWETRLPDLKIPPTLPGGPRGSPTYYHGLLWVAGGSRVYVLNPNTGAVLSMYYIGGRMGIVNPVIAGGTMYLSNSYGWVVAVPLSQIFPGWYSY